jgi:hypothetical protein
MHILVGVDAACGHPEPQLVIVGREREGHGKGQGFRTRLASFRNDPRERASRRHRVEAVAFHLGHDRRMQCGRHGYGIAVDAKIERNDGWNPDMAEPQARGNGNGCQQMRCVEQTDIELVAHIRPGHFPHQSDLQPFGRGKTLVYRNDDRGGIDQRDEADMKRRGHLRSSEAVKIDWAISPIFFFSRIAVERIST